MFRFSRLGRSVPVCLFACLLGVTAQVSAQEVSWARQFGVNGYAYGNRVASGEGNYVGAAIRYGEALPGQTAAGGQDAVLRRYDNDGAIRFTRQFGTAGNDEARGTLLYNQYIYVVGYVEGPLPGQPYAGNADAFIRKYDGYGNVIWTQQFGTTARDEAFFVAAAGGVVYVVGGTKGVLEPGYNNANAITQVFVRAFNTSGATLFTRQIAHAVNLETNVAGLAADNAGVYIASNATGGAGAFVDRFSPSGASLGATQLTANFLPGDVSGLAVDSSGFYIAGPHGSDTLVVKFSKAAFPTELWSKHLGTPTQTFDLTVTAGALYLAGQTSGAFPGRTNAGGTDMFAARLDSATGNTVWATQVGGTGNDIAKGVSVASGFLYLTGATTHWLAGSYSLDAVTVKLYTEPEWTINFPQRGFHSGLALGGGALYAVDLPSDGLVYKYDPFNGTAIWSKPFPGGYPTAVAYSGGGVYVAGQNTGQILVKKYDASGNLIWQTAFAGESPTAIAVNAECLVVTAGNQVFRLTPWSGALGWVTSFGPAGSKANGVALASSSIHVAGEVGGQAMYRVYSQQGTLGPSRTLEGFSARGIVSVAHGVYVLHGGLPPNVSRFTSDGTRVWVRNIASFTPYTSFQTFSLTADNDSIYVGGFVDFSSSHIDVGVVALNAYGQETWRRLVPRRGSPTSMAATGGLLYLGCVIDGLPTTGGAIIKITGPGTAEALLTNLRILSRQGGPLTAAIAASLEDKLGLGDFAGLEAEVQSLISTGTIDAEQSEGLLMPVRDLRRFSGPRR